VSAGPAVTLMLATALPGYVIVHPRPAGALPLVVVSDRFNDTDPPGTADAEANVNDAV
jgi:hypothetical protein